MPKYTSELKRCRRCSGILQSEEGFSIDEACRCETKAGRRARDFAMSATGDSLGGERPASLQELLSDPGRVW